MPTFYPNIIEGYYEYVGYDFHLTERLRKKTPYKITKGTDSVGTILIDIHESTGKFVGRLNSIANPAAFDYSTDVSSLFDNIKLIISLKDVQRKVMSPKNVYIWKDDYVYHHDKPFGMHKAKITIIKRGSTIHAHNPNPEMDWVKIVINNEWSATITALDFAIYTQKFI
jgi:hypothetical protein